MQTLVVKGGKKLSGTVSVSGAKNVALKALVAACLTNEKVVIENIPLISDFFVMVDIIKQLGGKIEIHGHTATVHVKNISQSKVSLEKAAEVRTSSMFIAPLLARTKQALIPNPGGCRIGARPIDRTIKGLRKMGADIKYKSSDGYFHAKALKRLKGISYIFDKNTHTGTETLMLAAVTAKGRTVLLNSAAEPEIDELIELLNSMGASIKRTEPRTIVIDGVEKLNGARFTIGSDRNEIVTFAIAAILTGGDILVRKNKNVDLSVFLKMLNQANCGFEEKRDSFRFYSKGSIKPTNIIASYHPGFMTDWQGPWVLLMTKADGVSTMHETVYESRFGYVEELKKMGARIDLFQPKVDSPDKFYNFNVSDDKDKYKHAARIYGPTKLHNGVVVITDLRAGATLVLAALAAPGTSVIFGVEHIDRGYEKFDQRLRSLGAQIKRLEEA